MKNILIIGAGMMGTQIAFQCATNNYQVSIYDIKEESLAYSKKTMQQYLAIFETKKLLTKEETKRIFNNITFTTDAVVAGTNADFISESVPEDPKLKANIFKQFNEIAPPHAIFTTNTSTLIPSMYSEATGRPDRFAALHFHPDVWENRIVDVMPHPTTSPTTIDLIASFARSINQVPIILEKEHHSYVFNNMLSSLIDSAISLAANNVASIQDIDRSWMGIMHSKIGPFGIMDLIGLETIYHILKYWADTTSDPDKQAYAKFLEPYIKNNELGIKSSKGFYTYPNPEYTSENFV